MIGFINVICGGMLAYAGLVELLVEDFVSEQS